MVDSQSSDDIHNGVIRQETCSLATVRRIVPDETLLFQYSALGFNSHKIRLDRDLMRDEKEGFPDLVINGGLATLMLTEFFRNELGGIPAALSAKHVTPLFCNRPVLLGAERQDGKWLLRALHPATSRSRSGSRS